MKSGHLDTARDLFASVGEDGVRWMFSLLPDGLWEITRDGARVDAGPTDGRSLRIGLEKFMTLSRSGAGIAASDPVVQKHVDWIQGSIERESGAKAISGTPAPVTYSTFAAIRPSRARMSRSNKKLQTEMKDLP
jgi:hypothetical protein